MFYTWQLSILLIVFFHLSYYSVGTRVFFPKCTWSDEALQHRSSWPRNWTRVSCIAGDSLPTELSGKPLYPVCREYTYYIKSTCFLFLVSFRFLYIAEIAVSLLHYSFCCFLVVTPTFIWKDNILCKKTTFTRLPYSWVGACDMTNSWTMSYK